MFPNSFSCQAAHAYFLSAAHVLSNVNDLNRVDRLLGFFVELTYKIKMFLLPDMGWHYLYEGNIVWRNILERRRAGPAMVVKLFQESILLDLKLKKKENQRRVKGALSRFAVFWPKLHKYVTKNRQCNKKLFLQHIGKIILRFFSEEERTIISF